MKTPKNSNHLQSHSRAVMALDHSGLDYTWKTNQAEFFAFDKFTLQHLAKQIRGCVNQPFTIFQDKLHLVNIQDDQLWAFSETVVTCKL